MGSQGVHNDDDFDLMQFDKASSDPSSDDQDHENDGEKDFGDDYVPSGGDLIDLGTSNAENRQRIDSATIFKESRNASGIANSQQNSQLTQLICLDCDYFENKGKKISQDQQRYINSIINPLLVNCKTCGQQVQYWETYPQIGPKSGHQCLCDICDCPLTSAGGGLGYGSAAQHDCIQALKSRVSSL